MGFRSYASICILGLGLFFGVDSVGMNAQTSRGDAKIQKKDFYITGFGPFCDSDKDGKLDRNPTQDVIEYFKGRGYNAEVLKTNYKKSTNRLEEIIKEYNPKLIMSLGVSEGVDSINLSMAATNRYHLKKKGFGRRLRGFNKIDKSLDKIIFLNKNDLSYVYKHWGNDNISFKEEWYSGNIECNYLLFKGIDFTKDIDTKFFFIHVPYDVYSNHEIFLNLERAIESLVDSGEK